MAYDLGNAELDAKVRALIAATSNHENQELIAELVTTALKLHRDGASRADLRLMNTALKEMRYSNLVFSRHREPKVTIYGSARLTETDPNYLLAEEFAALIVTKGWGVITGAGPGIMEAGARGAGIERSYGVNIRLPFEAIANRFLDPDRTVNFKYFFTRKLAFVKESHAFAILPGGWGTLDEGFELLTLIQTGKSDMHPIVLLEVPGANYWDPMIDFIKEHQLRRGLISEPDLALFHHTTDPVEACDHIWHFYANYHSQRYAGGRLVLRLVRGPDDDELEELNREFADIVVEGRIERSEPTAPEISDFDALETDRISFVFDRRQFGRLRQLIDHVNDLVAIPETFELPEPMTEEQAERPW
ncbi:MAG TPA: TIGR00730 family Rossman fold protein [Acidimicrobiia bacterium]|nr:TIGR00730 family Rossman fold protein [Acidimicrobiia bacterium]